MEKILNSPASSTEKWERNESEVKYLEREKKAKEKKSKEKKK